jgi:hypothetical protein
MGREVWICYFLELHFELFSMGGGEEKEGRMIAELWGRFSVHTPAQGLAYYPRFSLYLSSLHFTLITDTYIVTLDSL